MLTPSDRKRLARLTAPRAACIVGKRKNDPMSVGTALLQLGGLAEFERELIRARTGEGRKRAQERGVRFGRPRKLTSHQRAEGRSTS